MAWALTGARAEGQACGLQGGRGGDVYYVTEAEGQVRPRALRYRRGVDPKHTYKYINKILYRKTVFRVPVKVRQRDVTANVSFRLV